VNPIDLIMCWVQTQIALRRVLKIIGKRSFKENPLLYHRIVSTCGAAYYQHMMKEEASP